MLFAALTNEQNGVDTIDSVKITKGAYGLTIYDVWWKGLQTFWNNLHYEGGGAVKCRL